MMARKAPRAGQGDRIGDGNLILQRIPVDQTNSLMVRRLIAKPVAAGIDR